MTLDINNPNDFLTAIESTPSDEMEFAVNRDSIIRNETFSREALEQLFGSIGAFITSRAFKRMAAGEPGPKQMRVQVSVILDGAMRRVPEDEYPWYLLDGRGRLDPEARAVLSITDVLDSIEPAARIRVLTKLRDERAKEA